MHAVNFGQMKIKPFSLVLFNYIALHGLVNILVYLIGSLKEEKEASGTLIYGNYYRAICQFAKNQP